MECIKKLIIDKNKELLIKEYTKLVNSKRINSLIIDMNTYNNLSYLPEDKRIKMSITIDFDNELEYWMWLASPLLKEYLIKDNEYNRKI